MAGSRPSPAPRRPKIARCRDESDGHDAEDQRGDEPPQPEPLQHAGASRVDDHRGHRDDQEPEDSASAARPMSARSDQTGQPGERQRKRVAGPRRRRCRPRRRSENAGATAISGQSDCSPTVCGDRRHAAIRLTGRRRTGRPRPARRTRRSGDGSPSCSPSDERTRRRVSCRPVASCGRPMPGRAIGRDGPYRDHQEEASRSGCAGRRRASSADDSARDALERAARIHRIGAPRATLPPPIMTPASASPPDREPSGR